MPSNLSNPLPPISHNFQATIFLKMSTGDFRVADISLADFGRKEIEIAEHEVNRASKCCLDHR